MLKIFVDCCSPASEMIICFIESQIFRSWLCVILTFTSENSTLVAEDVIFGREACEAAEDSFSLFQTWKIHSFVLRDDLGANTNFSMISGNSVNMFFRGSRQIARNFKTPWPNDWAPMVSEDPVSSSFRGSSESVRESISQGSFGYFDCIRIWLLFGFNQRQSLPEVFCKSNSELGHVYFS